MYPYVKILYYYYLFCQIIFSSFLRDKFVIHSSVNDVSCLILRIDYNTVCVGTG